MISDEDRQGLTALAFKALDSVEEYGPDARLGDAVIVFEVLTPDPDDPDGQLNEGRYHSTTKRTAIAVGLLELAKVSMLRFFDE